MIKRSCLFLFCLMLHFTSQAQTITRLDGSKTSAKALDQQIQTLMQAAEVQGLAVTVFNQNQPVYKKTFGYNNYKTKKSIQTSTNF